MNRGDPDSAPDPARSEPSRSAVWNGVRYEDTGGEAEPLVLLHGLGGSCRSWTTVAGLLPQRRCISIDIPGFGQSRLARGGFTAAGMVDPIERLLDHLGVDRLDVAGHSFGALIATELATRGRVRSLTLVSGTLFSALDIVRHPPSFRHRPAMAAAIGAQFVGAMMRGGSRVVDVALSTDLGRRATLWPFVADPRRLSDADVRTALAGNAGGLAALRSLRVLAGWDLPVTASRVRCPVGLLWGDADRLIDESDIASAHALLPVERTLCLPGIGHWPPIEAPHETAGFLG